MSAITESAAPSPQLFFETANAYQRTEALRAAIELKLFTTIAEGKQTAEQIATACRASVRGIRILCDFLVVHGFLQKDARRYRLTRDTKVFLNEHSPAYIGGALRFLNLPTTLDSYKNLAEVVRKGGSITATNGLTPENPIWVEFARGMAPLMSMPAEQLAKFLKADEGQTWKVLSLAAGHGLYEITLARHNRSAEVWAVDWPNVLEVARENAAAAGLGGRYHTIPGSAFEVEYGDGYDLALVVNFLHHFDVAACEKLLRKVHAALKPGGRVVLLEFVPNDDRVSPPLPATFSMIMLAATPGGDAYTFKEFQGMLANAGYRDSELHPLPPTFFNVVIASK